MAIPNQVNHRETYRQQLAEGLIQPVRSRGHGGNAIPPTVVGLPKRPQRAPLDDPDKKTLAEKLGLAVPPRYVPPDLLAQEQQPAQEVASTHAATPEAVEPLACFGTLAAREAEEELAPVALAPIAIVAPTTEAVLDLGATAKTPVTRPLI